MKETYKELILRIAAFVQTDVIAASVEKGDNTVEDDFFDEECWEVCYENFWGDEKNRDFRVRIRA